MIQSERGSGFLLKLDSRKTPDAQKVFPIWPRRPQAESRPFVTPLPFPPARVGEPFPSANGTRLLSVPSAVPSEPFGFYQRPETYDPDAIPSHIGVLKDRACHMGASLHPAPPFPKPLIISSAVRVSSSTLPVVLKPIAYWKFTCSAETENQTTWI